jgi:ferredoxin
MRVVVEENLCEGHGLCVEIAPEIFRIRDDGIAEVLIENPEGALEEGAKESARRCPASAIYVVL